MDTERQPSSRRTVAILSRGDAVARREATSKNGRFVDVFEALAAVGVEGRPAIYDESFADDVREELLAVDGVLVWVNPIQDGRNRAGLDTLLREVAARGVWVSAHPDVILKMGTKEVLYRTRSMGWGSDTAPHLISRGGRYLSQISNDIGSSAGAGQVAFILRRKSEGTRLESIG